MLINITQVIISKNKYKFENFFIYYWIHIHKIIKKIKKINKYDIKFTI